MMLNKEKREELMLLLKKHESKEKTPPIYGRGLPQT